MYTTTVKKRDLFFKYLEEEGLVPYENHNILEVAPSVIVSQSLLLAQKYGELYKHFLVSKRFEQEDFKGIPVNGMLGSVILEKGNLAVPTAYRDKLISIFKIFRSGPFDTLLIQGQPEEAYSLLKARQCLLFGDVCEAGDRETRDIYNDLIKTIRAYNIRGEEYELIREQEYGDEFYLIRNKTLRKHL